MGHSGGHQKSVLPWARIRRAYTSLTLPHSHPEVPLSGLPTVGKRAAHRANRWCVNMWTGDGQEENLDRDVLLAESSARASPLQRIVQPLGTLQKPIGNGNAAPRYFLSPGALSSILRSHQVSRMRWTMPMRAANP